MNELEVSLDEKHSIRQLLQAAPSRETWKHPKVEPREEKEREEEVEEEVEKHLVDLVADETDICSAKRPKCKYPTGEQVGAVKSLKSIFSQKIFQIFGVQSVKLHIAYYFMLR